KTHRNPRGVMHHSKKQIQGRRAGQTLKFSALLLALALTSCQHYNAINFVTNTQFGAKVGVNAEKIPEIQIGYNRHDAAWVPNYLMTTKDLTSASPPTINALLNGASESLAKAKLPPVAVWGSDTVAAVQMAQRLINKAKDMDIASETNTTSTLLSEIK